MKEDHDITRKSPFSGITHTLTIHFDMEDYKAWESGAKLIEDAFPYLTPDEREFLKTGITAEEWDKLFKEE